MRMDCFYEGNGRGSGGRMVVENRRVNVIDHPRKLHTHSVLCRCGGRVVEILRRRVCVRARILWCARVIYKRFACLKS